HAEHEFDASGHLLRHQNPVESLSGTGLVEILLEARIRGVQLVFVVDADDDPTDIGFVRALRGEKLEHHRKSDIPGSARCVAGAARNDLARRSNAIASQKLL